MDDVSARLARIENILVSRDQSDHILNLFLYQQFTTCVRTQNDIDMKKQLLTLQQHSITQQLNILESRSEQLWQDYKNMATECQTMFQNSSKDKDGHNSNISSPFSLSRRSTPYAPNFVKINNDIDSILPSHSSLHHHNTSTHPDPHTIGDCNNDNPNNIIKHNNITDKRNNDNDTNNRGFICPICVYTSKDLEKMKKHVKTKHGRCPLVKKSLLHDFDTEYVLCPLCPSKFTHIRGAKIHLRAVHGPTVFYRTTEYETSKGNTINAQESQIETQSEPIKSTNKSNNNDSIAMNDNHNEKNDNNKNTIENDLQKKTRRRGDVMTGSDTVTTSGPTSPLDSVLHSPVLSPSSPDSVPTPSPFSDDMSDNIPTSQDPIVCKVELPQTPYLLSPSSSQSTEPQSLLPTVSQSQSQISTLDKVRGYSKSTTIIPDYHNTHNGALSSDGDHNDKDSQSESDDNDDDDDNDNDDSNQDDDDDTDNNSGQDDENQNYSNFCHEDNLDCHSTAVPNYPTTLSPPSTKSLQSQVIRCNLSVEILSFTIDTPPISDNTSSSPLLGYESRASSPPTLSEILPLQSLSSLGELDSTTTTHIDISTSRPSPSISIQSPSFHHIDNVTRDKAIESNLDTLATTSPQTSSQKTQQTIPQTSPQTTTSSKTRDDDDNHILLSKNNRIDHSATHSDENYNLVNTDSRTIISQNNDNMGGENNMNDVVCDINTDTTTTEIYDSNDNDSNHVDYNDNNHDDADSDEEDEDEDEDDDPFPNQICSNCGLAFQNEYLLNGHFLKCTIQSTDRTRRSLRSAHAVVQQSPPPPKRSRHR